MILDIKTLLISRQSSHNMSLINNYITNYFISYNLIHVSILKNMFLLDLLLTIKRLVKNKIKINLCSLL